MATDSSVIVDCDSDTFMFSSESGGGWQKFHVGEMYKGTSWMGETDESDFDFLFEGMSVAFIGAAGGSSSRNRSTVQIDNGTVLGINYNADQTYKPWFQSTRLPEGKHTVTVRNVGMTQTDFAVINVGTQTALSGKTIVVDNESPSILYSGHWSRNTSQFRSGYLGVVYPYGNSTHRSSTPGDTFTFRFIGTSISVYGIFDWNNQGTLSATFTIDGATIPRTYTQTEVNIWDGETPNFVYYSLDNLSAGDHTLIVNITAANNKTLMLDYITYTPSFPTLSSIPLLSNTTSTIASVKSSTSSGNPASQSPQVQTPGTSKPLPTAAIVGGVIGALALGVLVTTIGLFLWRRKFKQTENISHYLYAPTDERHYWNDASNLNVPPRKHQQNLQLSNSRVHNLPVTVNHRSSPVVQATVSRLPLSGPLDGPVAEVVTEPPDYDTLSH